MTVLDDARALLETGPLCDACLGRPFSDRSFGLTNDERGRALRTAIALEDDDDYEPTPPEDCWVCEGFCGEYDEWAERVAQAVEDIHFETYQVGTRTPPLIEENDVLLREDAGLDADAGELFKSEFNREVGKRVGQKTDTMVDFERPDVLALLNLERDGDVEIQVNPAFVYGRYRKLERDIPQTEWPCRECGGSGKDLGPEGEIDCDHCGGSGYLYDDSVEGYVAPHVREAMEGEDAVFHGAGREDVDALMLERGRPFVAEVKEPGFRSPDVEALEAQINEEAEGSVEVEGLRLATHEMVERVKELEASKTYRMDVEFAEPVENGEFEAALDELEGATIEQYTPERVDHRRASLTRTREVYEVEGELLDDRHADIELHGAGGLYVKELVSSDNGRTEPSLSGILGVDAEVTALDVLDVEGEEEAFEQAEFFRES
ncbi:tRNA pseudouridine(54/55) synthase Pus10 [Natranaeroarchaeum aerophilus]|uniref:tRNA pseudouridine synthase Pus10 n=1 Tax=Natranaeroarchaeum aerophilus TaxID=2917711 RepID=A0AAE3FP31_9EURY|nr:tRNA pseudouridine(54/55) synthase Pus10 [Natranaeroarchaeum aerophilus]MCL9812634.1 tRNA pseudouridine(54/55) synthase Pus10 [Natranaeroarchaeum aerophilus]